MRTGVADIQAEVVHAELRFGDVLLDVVDATADELLIDRSGCDRGRLKVDFRPERLSHTLALANEIVDSGNQKLGMKRLRDVVIRHHLVAFHLIDRQVTG